ncbi:1383_t:CDS:1, partial [Funneliformis mosseae]
NKWFDSLSAISVGLNLSLRKAFNDARFVPIITSRYCLVTNLETQQMV